MVIGKILHSRLYFKKKSKKVRDTLKDLDHKNAFLAKEITLAEYLYAQAANIQFIEYLEDDSVEIIVAPQLQDMSIDESSIDYLESFLTGITSTASSLLDNTIPSEVWTCLVCGEEAVTK